VAAIVFTAAPYPPPKDEASYKLPKVSSDASRIADLYSSFPFPHLSPLLRLVAAGASFFRLPEVEPKAEPTANGT
jgi:hypothetical protein